jgi:plastocyanin
MEAETDAVRRTQVSVEDFRCDPPQMLVQRGATVTWTWAGQEPQDVVGAAGEFVDNCTLHGTPTSGLRGAVRVE